MNDHAHQATRCGAPRAQTARRWTRRALFAAFTGSALAVGVHAEPESPNAPPGTSQRDPEAAPQRAVSARLREGTTITDRSGYFTLDAQTATFSSEDGQHQFGGLPNLNLERIVRTVRQRPEQLIWSVSGTVTEYHGTNFLLVSRAVLKSKRRLDVPQPAPGP
jgi:hypothetical protein